MTRKAEIHDALTIALLAIKLWPDHTMEDLIEKYGGHSADEYQ